VAGGVQGRARSDPTTQPAVRALLQRTTGAEVRVEGETVGEIGPGLVILLGVGPDDTEVVADALARRAAELRIFRDDEGRTNRSLLDVGGAALVVSQFTLFADTRRGRRPGFTGAAPPDLAERLYLRFTAALTDLGVVVARGRFGAEMAVELVNDGPFTIWLDTDER
jgi:D-tyrosyl-tRNA(Tyr) deacylase